MSSSVHHTTHLFIKLIKINILHFLLHRLLLFISTRLKISSTPFPLSTSSFFLAHVIGVLLFIFIGINTVDVPAYDDIFSCKVECGGSVSADIIY